MSPARRAAWARYYRARIDSTEAGALVMALIDAYEEAEIARGVSAEDETVLDAPPLSEDSL